MSTVQPSALSDLLVCFCVGLCPLCAQGLFSVCLFLLCARGLFPCACVDKQTVLPTALLSPGVSVSVMLFRSNWFTNSQRFSRRAFSPLCWCTAVTDVCTTLALRLGFQDQTQADHLHSKRFYTLSCLVPTPPLLLTQSHHVALKSQELTT